MKMSFVIFVNDVLTAYACLCVCIEFPAPSINSRLQNMRCVCVRGWKHSFQFSSRVILLFFFRAHFHLQSFVPSSPYCSEERWKFPWRREDGRKKKKCCRMVRTQWYARIRVTNYETHYRAANLIFKFLNSPRSLVDRLVCVQFKETEWMKWMREQFFLRSVTKLRESECASRAAKKAGNTRTYRTVSHLHRPQLRYFTSEYAAHLFRALRKR